MTYQLHMLRTQLDNHTATAGDDCAVESIINACLTVSDGKVGPQNAAQHPGWVHLVRTAAGRSAGGLLFRRQTLKAYRSPLLLHEFDKVGLPRPHIDYFDGVGPERLGWGHVIRRLKAGWICHLPIDYGVLNHDGVAPSGSLSFMDGHSIVLANPHKQGRHHWLYVDVADSLMDGRIRLVWQGGRLVEHKYPSGWQRVRLLDYRRPAGAWGQDPAGAGHAYCIFLKARP